MTGRSHTGLMLVNLMRFAEQTKNSPRCFLVFWPFVIFLLLALVTYQWCRHVNLMLDVQGNFKNDSSENVLCHCTVPKVSIFLQQMSVLSERKILYIMIIYTCCMVVIHMIFTCIVMPVILRQGTYMKEDLAVWALVFLLVNAHHCT